mgnify:CR=1 FL=1|tara:strand:- start:7244 stop:7630 length:387 start_codon:yes stop_codon:yes gene_type:complete
MSKYRILTFALLLVLTGAKTSDVANNKANDYDIYIPPTSSIVCDSLKKGLRSQINQKQKIDFLLIRNRKLLKAISQRKKTLITQLRENQTKLRSRKLKNVYKIKTLEEKIIRQGCPGILTPSFARENS